MGWWSNGVRASIGLAGSNRLASRAMVLRSGIVILPRTDRPGQIARLDMSRCPTLRGMPRKEAAGTNRLPGLRAS